MCKLPEKYITIVVYAPNSYPWKHIQQSQRMKTEPTPDEYGRAGSGSYV